MIKPISATLNRRYDFSLLLSNVIITYLLSQMVRIDENQEAIARIRMAVNSHDKEVQRMNDELDKSDGEQLPPPTRTQAHWAVGSRQRKIELGLYEEQNSDNPAFRRFGSRLLSFFQETLNSDTQLRPPFHVSNSDLLLSLDSNLSVQIIPYQCLYLQYRSLEDWREKRDILRCNPRFYGAPRYDCVVINTSPISFARLQGLFTCRDLDKKECTVALVSLFQPSTWKPRTNWDWCRVFEERGYSFVLLDYLVRGCHMIPVFDNPGIFFLNDLVDGDAFIRFYLQNRLYG